MNNRPKEDWAYLAGFLDGEGCINAHAAKRNLTPRISVTQKNLEQLVTLRDRFDVGWIKERGDGQYHWLITRVAEIEWTLRGVLPYSLLKRSQIELALQIIDLPWGSKQEKILLRAEITRLKHV